MRLLSHASFQLFIALVFLTYSVNWDTGPFSWGCLPVQIGSYRVGVLALLPFVTVAAWGLLVWQRRKLQWGNRTVLAGGVLFTLAVGVNLVSGVSAYPLVPLTMLGFSWFAYLFVVDQRPSLVWVLASVVALQSLVAIGQFVVQQEVGLQWLGEPVLDKLALGTSVVLNGEEVWLRGYGINSHPNRLGMKLALFVPLLWLTRATDWKRYVLTGAILLGIAGLLVSVSRSAWVALGVAMAYALWRKREIKFNWVTVGGGLLVLVFMGLYGGVVFGRIFALDTPLEAQSLYERNRDTRLAVQIIAEHPWLGVGIGNVETVAQTIDSEAGLVHNIPLLIAGQLGIIGLLAWISWLIMLWRESGVAGRIIWLIVVVFGLFQPEPSPLSGLQGAILFGLMLGIMARKPDNERML